MYSVDMYVFCGRFVNMFELAILTSTKATYCGEPQTGKFSYVYIGALSACKEQPIKYDGLAIQVHYSLEHFMCVERKR